MGDHRRKTTPPLDPRLVKIAENMAASFSRRLPRNVLAEDVRQAALLGIVDALRLHPEGGMGPGWEWYVACRVRGSILDELRAQDWAPRRRKNALGESNVTARVVHFEDLTDGHGQPLDPESGAPSPEHVATLRVDAAKALAVPMSARDRAIIVERYGRERRQREVADDIAVSEPRICQLEHRALDRMRRALAS